MKKSKYELNQFTEIKKIINNVSYSEFGTKLVCPEILLDVIDELRNERKILMAIKDDDVDKYINMEMTELDIYEAADNADLDQEIRFACQNKVAFRK